MTKKEILEIIIEEIECILTTEAQLSALAMTLIAIDACSAIKYPDITGHKQRYQKWYDEYIGLYENSNYEKDENGNEVELPKEEQFPYLSKEVIYSLRCNLLHEGIPELDDENKITEEINKSVKWDIYFEHKRPYLFYYSSAGKITNNGREMKRYSFNIRLFCEKTLLILKGFIRNEYLKFPEKFDVESNINLNYLILNSGSYKSVTRDIFLK